MKVYIQSGGQPRYLYEERAYAWLIVPERGPAQWVRKDGRIIRDYRGAPANRPNEFSLTRYYYEVVGIGRLTFDEDLRVDEGL